MPALLRNVIFPAKLSNLQALRRFVDGFCTAAGIGSDDCLRLNLLLEELFTNTVRHGHRGDTDACVWVTLCLDDQAVKLTYEDTAPAFNPYGSPDETLHMPKHGGLGVRLTKKLAVAREYAYLYGRNRIRLTLALS